MINGVRFLTAEPNVSDVWPCFSPDGETVLFSRTDGKNWTLYRVPASGGSAEKFMRQSLSVGETRPKWLPLNNQVAFSGTTPAEDATGVLPPETAALWIVNGDGSGAHAVMASDLSDHAYYPSWYPDGERLSVMDARDFTIKRVDLRTGKAVAVTDCSRVLAGMSSVSPDGKWIAFAGQKNEGQSYNQEKNILWLVGDDGSLRTLEAQPLQGRAPIWSPDGSRLAFQANRGSTDGRYAAFVIDRDGTNPIRLTDYVLHAGHPIWSPDGRRMVFDCVPPGVSQCRGIAIIDFP